MWKIFLTLLLLPALATAEEMVPVEKADGFCGSNEETYCYEWRVPRLAGLRFVAHGDEDTIEYAFYEVGASGYRKLADIFPLLEDPTHPGRLFWGYPWDITGVKLGSAHGKPALLGTRNHDIKVSDEYDVPISDEVRWAVLFVGRTTQIQRAQPSLTLEPALPQDLGDDG